MHNTRNVHFIIFIIPKKFDILSTNSYNNRYFQNNTIEKMFTFSSIKKKSNKLRKRSYVTATQKIEEFLKANNLRSIVRPPKSKPT